MMIVLGSVVGALLTYVVARAIGCWIAGETSDGPWTGCP